MRDKFSCGHLVLQKDGTLKLLGRNESGGSRVCKITRFDMDFDEIHDRLREMFSIGDRNSRIYDVNRKELDKNQYRNFYDYMDKKGANYKGNALFLCTLADDRIDFDSSAQRRTTVTSNSVPVVVTNSIRQIEVQPTPLIVVAKREQEPPAFNKLFINHQQFANVQISSYSNYLFGQSLNELVDYLNDLLQQYHHEKILIELYGQICTLRGLTLKSLDRIKQQNHQTNEKSDDSQELENINILSRSIKAFIELNKITISHIDQHSIITNSFNKFHEHLNTLCGRRANERNTHKHRTSYSSTNDSVKPTSRRHSDRNSRKRSEPSSRSSSSYRQATETNVIDNGYSLFKNLLKSLDLLFKILRERRFISFGNLVTSLILEMESYRSNIKLYDYRSLSSTENLMISARNRLLSRINDENNRITPNKVPDQLPMAYKNVLDSLDGVLNSIESFQSKINKRKRSRPTSHEKHKRIIRKSTQSRTKVDNDNESSDASRSSVDDEILQKEARDTCGQGFQHRKKFGVFIFEHIVKT